ncbi:MAG TPA: pantetheine-phosphate adenylyltransferase [Anaerolineales bacterium]|nr:pantetheine-phosphate adenylyltransferase [Anaerolineales bacterium]HLE73967.1 pantetheine-phosphate adenylyltransferase [Anaerolineales bacterium]
MMRALFPATFDPIHNGHIDIAARAARLFDEVVVGVYETPLKSLLLPTETRLALVQETFKGQAKIKVMPYQGLTVDFARKVNAQVIVRGLRVLSDFEYEFRMALANRQLAPDIETVSLITSKEHSFLSSTTVREIASLGGNVGAMVPVHVNKALAARFAEIKRNGEAEFIASPPRD